MPRSKKQTVILTSTSYDDLRKERGLPPSINLRERGKCFDCGIELHAGSCGGWHSRMEGGTRGYGFYVEYCCVCAHG